MSKRGSRWRSGIGFLAAATVAATVSTARAEPTLRANTIELGISVGASVRHDIPSGAGEESVTGFHLLPHAGWIATDEVGPGGLRGNFELLAEPTLIYLDGDSSSATVGGGAVFSRWLFVGTGRVRPYLEIGAGVVAGQTNFVNTACDVNFIVAAGPGVMLFLSESAAVTLGYRYHHLSNGDRCARNTGVNSSLFLVGVSYFFR
jgi:hypothetical protein